MIDKLFTDKDGVVWEPVPGEEDCWELFFTLDATNNWWLYNHDHIPFLEKHGVIRRVGPKFEPGQWYQNEDGMVVRCRNEKTGEIGGHEGQIAFLSSNKWTPVRIVPERAMRKPCFALDTECVGYSNGFCLEDNVRGWWGCFPGKKAEQSLIDWLSALLESC